MTEKPYDEAFHVLARYIAKEKADALEARELIETRGARVVSSSAALVALIVGLVSILLGKNSPALTDPTAICLVIAALFFFVVAAGFGFYVQNSAAPRKSSAISTLEQMVYQDSVWNGSSSDAIRSCSHLDIQAIASLRETAKCKAYACNCALLLQAIAALLLTSSFTVEMGPW